MSDLQEQISAKANLAVAQLQDRAAGTLDFSQGSLTQIEEMLDEASQYIDQMPDDQIEALVSLVGSYIFEVALRQFGGVFYWHTQNNQPVFVTGEPAAHIALITFDKVRSRLRGDVSDNIPFFYEGFATRATAPVAGTKVLYV